MTSAGASKMCFPDGAWFLARVDECATALAPPMLLQTCRIAVRFSTVP